MKAAKYLIAIVVILVVAYHSIYFKKLDEIKASRSGKEFNAATYVQTFWNNKLMPGLNKAIDITRLTSILSIDAPRHRRERKPAHEEFVDLPKLRDIFGILDGWQPASNRLF